MTLVVYYGGPDQYHASYAVRVVPVDLIKASSDSGFEQFTQFTSLIRINETVSKVYASIFFTLKITEDETSICGT